MTGKFRLFSILIFLALVILAGCRSQANTLRPVESEQIENVVIEFMQRDTNIPDVQVTIEEVANNWARVSVKPRGVEGEADIFYLQKQVAAPEAPEATAAAQAGHEARVETSTGWTIILGPEADYTVAELNEVGVPAEVRP